MATALTMDIKGSRSYTMERRNSLQALLIQSMELVNRLFRPSLLRELSFSGGDEIQGLFQSTGAAFLCLRLLRRVAFPVELHAGLGQGEWTTVIPARNTFYQDGTAYHRAREAVEQVKKDTDGTVLFIGEENREAMVNAMLNADTCLINGNTARQNDMALLMECLYPIQPHEGLELRRLTELPCLMRQWYAYSEADTKRSQRKTPAFYSSAADRIEQEAFQFIDVGSQWKKRLGISYEYAHPFGTASVLATGLGMTRQGVDTALRAGKIYAERELALAILELLG